MSDQHVCWLAVPWLVAALMQPVLHRNQSIFHAGSRVTASRKGRAHLSLQLRRSGRQSRIVATLKSLLRGWSICKNYLQSDRSQ
ncbi:MAG TPA: hypothetical protein VJ698_14605 [Noviherbaspirillum sp.]|nr:hypothetical protein [Noviherbaspirillum sp.]